MRDRRPPRHPADRRHPRASPWMRCRRREGRQQRAQRLAGILNPRKINVCGCERSGDLLEGQCRFDSVRALLLADGLQPALLRRWKVEPILLCLPSSRARACPPFAVPPPERRVMSASASCARHHGGQELTSEPLDGQCACTHLLQGDGGQAGHQRRRRGRLKSAGGRHAREQRNRSLKLAQRDERRGAIEIGKTRAVRAAAAYTAGS